MVDEVELGKEIRAMSTFAVVAIIGQTIQPLMLFDDRAEADAIANELRHRHYQIEVRSVHDSGWAPSLFSGRSSDLRFRNN